MHLCLSETGTISFIGGGAGKRAKLRKKRRKDGKRRSERKLGGRKGKNKEKR